jgi:hypothetical protein
LAGHEIGKADASPIDLREKIMRMRSAMIRSRIRFSNSSIDRARARTDPRNRTLESRDRRLPDFRKPGAWFDIAQWYDGHLILEDRPTCRPLRLRHMTRRLEEFGQRHTAMVSPADENPAAEPSLKASRHRH